MTNAKIKQALDAFLAAKANNINLFVKYTVGNKILSSEIVADTFRVTSGNNVFIGGFIGGNERGADYIESDKFSFTSDADVNSGIPIKGRVIYNADGFSCISTGEVDAAGDLVVKTGNGLKSLKTYTQSNIIQQD
jgi:hypothetical protein